MPASRPCWSWRHKPGIVYGLFNFLQTRVWYSVYYFFSVLSPACCGPGCRDRYFRDLLVPNAQGPEM